MRRLVALGFVSTSLLLVLGFATAAPASATVLCKTNTSPCTGGAYAKGTTIEASLKSKTKSVFDGPAKVECEGSSLKGEVTNPGGEAVVSGTLSSLSFTACGSATVSVLKAGTFKVESPKEGSGTLKLEGLEATVETLGLHCIFSGTTSFSLKGGEMGSLVSPTALKRTGGRSGAFCGTEASWTVEYTVTTPAPLYVASRAADEWTMGGKALEGKVEVEFEGLLAVGSSSGIIECPVGFTLGAGPAGETVVTSVHVTIAGCAKPTGAWTGCFLIAASGTVTGKVDPKVTDWDITGVELKYTFDNSCGGERIVSVPFPEITAKPAGVPLNSLTLSGESSSGSFSILEKFEGSPSDVVTEVGETGTLTLME